MSPSETFGFFANFHKSQTKICCSCINLYAVKRLERVYFYYLAASAISVAIRILLRQGLHENKALLGFTFPMPGLSKIIRMRQVCYNNVSHFDWNICFVINQCTYKLHLTILINSPFDVCGLSVHVKMINRKIRLKKVI